MEFYPHLVAAYDEVFPVSPQMVKLVETPWHGKIAGLHLLDAGCGTGSMAITLARHGAKVSAFDLSEEMILAARGKQPQALNLQFHTGSLLSMTQSYTPETLDGIVCIGNTLAHLINPGELDLFFQQAYTLLKNGGYLLVQIVNYDRVMHHRPANLPTIDTENYLFERIYNYTLSKEIEFSFQLTPKSDGLSRYGKTMLKPIMKEELESISETQWNNTIFYGDWAGNAWHNESFHTIVLLQKQPLNEQN